MNKPVDIAVIPAAWQHVVLVCKKCSKKLEGGFGPGDKQPLGRALKQAARLAGRRQDIRVVEAKCFGICPKGAVTVLPASQPGRFLVVPAGTDPAALLAQVAEVRPQPTDWPAPTSLPP